MYKIKIIQSPKVIYFEKNERKEVESIVSISGETPISETDIFVNSEENSFGAEYTFKNENNKKIKLSGALDVDIDNDIVVNEEVYDILEKLAVATLCDELGDIGEEFTSEEVLSWDI
jgi:hypothetical protein